MPKPPAPKQPPPAPTPTSNVHRTIGLRLTDTLVAQIDELIPGLRVERPDATITQADMIRVLIVEGIMSRKAKAAKK